MTPSHIQYNCSKNLISMLILQFGRFESNRGNLREENHGNVQQGRVPNQIGDTRPTFDTISKRIQAHGVQLPGILYHVQVRGGHVRR